MKKILVVEDEYYARKSIVKILQESDLDIQVCGEAANGMKAIELLEEYKDIALVITDIQMQKMGGLELASYLHKHIPEIDVLTVGAGDVFHGAFLAAIVKGLSPKDAARFASGVAAIKCTRIGGRAGIPNWEVTDNFLETGEIDYREIDERVKKYGRGIEYV